MAEFKQGVLTKKGVELIAKVQAGSGSIKFTKFQIGNGKWDASASAEAISQAVALKSKKGEYDITKAEYVNDATTRLTLAASNQDNTSGGYYITEVGVFATDGNTEFLYSIYITEESKADWFPAYNSITPSSITYSCLISVANAANVTIKSDGAGVALQKDLLALEDRVGILEQISAACVGVRRKCAEDGTPQSSTKWERIGQSVGMNAAYARGNDAVNDPLMKIWPFNKLRPCDLAMDGTVTAYMGDPEFTWTGDNDTSVMLEIPTDMYFSKWQEKDANGQYWEYRVFADTGRFPNAVNLKELFKCADGTENSSFYFPIFLGSKNAQGHYVAVAGAHPQYDTSCTVYRTQVKTNGADWQLIDKWAWDIFANLCLCYSADNNFRTSFGRGHADWYVKYTAQAEKANTNTVTLPAAAGTKLFVGNSICVGTAEWDYKIARDRHITAIKASEVVDGAFDVTVDGDPFSVTTASLFWRSAPLTGETTTMAAANGTAGPNDGQHAVRTLWVEDFYGTMHTGLDGLNFKFNQNKMALECYVTNDPSKYSDTYDGYELLDAEIGLDANNASNNYGKDGWQKKSVMDNTHPTLDLPLEVGSGAGSETYMAAFRWANKNGQRPFAGGCFSIGSFVSPFFLGCYRGFSGANRDCASRPLKR